MSIYKPLINRALDESVIKVPDTATIYNPNPVYIGPPFSEAKGRYRIENFNPPVYQPSNVPTRKINCNNQYGTCPITPILLRNEWETMNTTNAVTYGGFDQWNIKNIPSCDDREGTYMNYKDSISPWGTVLVDASVPPGFDWVMDSHGYSSPWSQPRYLDKYKKWININSRY